MDVGRENAPRQAAVMDNQAALSMGCQIIQYTLKT